MFNMLFFHIVFFSFTRDHVLPTAKRANIYYILQINKCVNELIVQA